MVRYARHLGAGSLIALAAFGVVGCPSIEPDFPNRPRPVDAGTPADCHAACEHLRELKCEEGEPEEGVSCEEICEHVEASGTVTLDPACVLKITECRGIDGCTYGSR